MAPQQSLHLRHCEFPDALLFSNRVYSSLLSPVRVHQDESFKSFPSPATHLQNKIKYPSHNDTEINFLKTLQTTSVIHHIHTLHTLLYNTCIMTLRISNVVFRFRLDKHPLSDMV